MLVFVINKNGEALMPCSNRKARLLLKEQKAKRFLDIIVSIIDRKIN